MNSIETYKSMLLTDPENVQYLLGLAKAYEEGEDYEAAIETYSCIP